jgi:polysaccharide biosynthesis/export protein
MRQRLLRTWQAWAGALAVGACGLCLTFGFLRVADERQTTPTGAVSAESSEGDLEARVRFKRSKVLLCQCLSPAAPCPVPYADCAYGKCDVTLDHVSPLEFQKYAQGEYVGRSRMQHVPEYRLRPDDQIDFIYRLTRDETREAYELNIGDEVRIESFTDKNLDRTLVIQPDGTITLPLLGQVRAARNTVAGLRDDLEDRFKKFYKVPSIVVTPIKMNTKLDDLRAAIGGRSGFGPQVRPGKIMPDGGVALPAVGTVPAQGLTLAEFKEELDARYQDVIEGVEVTPLLMTRAARYCYVLGEVKTPGRYVLEAPTTVMQAIALAGSWNFGANVNQVVIFRRADDWRLIATVVSVRAALLGREICPAGEIWVSDSDLIILPKTKIQLTDNWIEMIFTKGLYGIFPFSGSISYTAITSGGFVP